MIICEIHVGKSVRQAEKINRNDVDNGIWGGGFLIFSHVASLCVFHIQSPIHYNMPVYHVSLGYFTNP